MKKVFFALIAAVVLVVVGNYAYQYKGSVKIKTSESPEEVVQKFYAFIGEGGSSSLAEAYKLLSTKHFTIAEDKFKGIVLNYPKDMKIKVVDGKVIEDHAVVTIEYNISSSFGGDFAATTEVNLDYDAKSNSWKIDFTSEASADTEKAS